ncbi:MAG TPA: copper homeostasis membrane protein CopD [Alphaproteobacteria bacterium]|nr:copper homeostasis membrane protein CopD [Alphaproteobacteria bacterium]
MDTLYFLSAAARASHYASVVLPFGSFTCAFVVARPAFRRVSNEHAERPKLRRFLLRLALGGTVAGAATTVLNLWMTAAGMSGQPLPDALRPEILGAVLTQTKFGHIWLVRIFVTALLAAVLGFLLLRRREKESLAGECFAALLAAALLASLAYIGHSNDGTGAEGAFRVGADMVHLLAAGAWLGALPGFVFMLARAGDPKVRYGLRLAHEAAVQFSPLGIVSVSLLLLTGTVNSWYLVGSVIALVGTTYGWILLLKLGILAIMLTVAAINRQRLTPRLDSSSSSARDARATLQALRRNSTIETGLGLILLCVVGALVAATPAAHEEPLWPFPYQLDTVGLVVTPELEAKFILAVLLALGGIGGIIWGLLKRFWWTPLGGLVMLGAALALPAPYLLTDAYPTSFYHSPVAYDAESIRRGEQAYDANCSACHGAYGYGDGRLADSLPIKPSDLTGAHLLHHGAGTLFWWISYGIEGTPMPGFDDRLDVDARWDTINFLRAQTDAEQSNGMDAAVEPFRPIVAPDFFFQPLNQNQETLKSLRGRTNVLLVLYSLPDSMARLEALESAKPSLAVLDTRIIAIAMTTDAATEGQPGSLASPSILADANPDVVAAYTLFRRVPTGEGVLPVPRHMEFLIDRAGYLRARWLPSEEKGWSDVAILRREIETLNKEPPREPAPEGHVH